MALAADLRARRELPPKLTCAAVMATMASAPGVRPLSAAACKKWRSHWAAARCEGLNAPPFKLVTKRVAARNSRYPDF